MAEQHCKLLIVGAGIFGTSTAYHLSAEGGGGSNGKIDGTDIRVIDRTPSPPAHAASTDVSKIIRMDYSIPFYMELASEAMQAWRTWPELKPFFHEPGWVHFSDKGSDLAQRIRANFAARAGTDPTSGITLDQARSQFNGIFKHADLDGCDSAYWNPEVGLCDAGAATAELMRAATARGVRYTSGEVQRLVLGAAGVEGVELSDGQLFTADKVLLCTGAWTSSVMSGVEDEFSLAEGARAEAQATAAGVCVAHYAIDDAEVERLKEMPVTIFGEQGDAQPLLSQKMLKFTYSGSLTNTVTTASGHKVTVPPPRDQFAVSEKLQQDTRERLCLPLLREFTTRKEKYWRLCWDAVTPSQDHLICRHPDERLRNLYLAIGGSFHSYKFLPNIGKYVAKVLEGGSNGAEHDRRWAWKVSNPNGSGAHEKVLPTRELRDWD